MHFVVGLFLRPNVVNAIEKYRTYFHQTFSFGTFWDKDERFNFLGSEGQRPKDQGHSMTKGLAGGGTQSPMMCIEI